MAYSSGGFESDHVIGGRREDIAQIQKHEQTQQSAVGMQMLKTKQLGTIFVDRVTILSVNKTHTIGDAFQLLEKNRISSVPVWCTTKRSYTHFIDVIDLVAFVLNELGPVDQGVPAERLPAVSKLPDFSQNAEAWAKTHVKVPYEPMEDHASILHAIGWMKKTGAARIPVVDNGGELQTIVTESGLIKFLHAHIAEFPQRTSTLEQLKLATTPFHSILSTARAVDAFRLMAQHRVSAVPVVNEKREIVGNISATDLGVINNQGGFAATLFLPAYLFLRLREDAHKLAAPVVAHPSSTLEEVLTQLVTYKIHQIYVTKAAAGQQGELCGAVDLRSLLQVLNIVP